MTLVPPYFDYLSTTPVDPRVTAKMSVYLNDADMVFFGNPASQHYYGSLAKQLVGQARTEVASLVNCEEEAIIWTSGATEANNLAIQGAANYYKRQGNHLITCTTEHKSVLATFNYLESIGFEVTYLDPQPDGRLALEKLAQSFRQNTILVSIMQVNSETGVIQDLERIGELTSSRGILFHVDGAQSVGKIPVNLKQLKVDLMSFSTHKIYGPKGIGALYVRTSPSKLRISPLCYGASQENGLRPGTLPVVLIVGMGEAFRLAKMEMVAESNRIGELRERLWQGLKKLPEVYLNGSVEHRVSGVLNVSFGGISSDSYPLSTKFEKLAISSFSACNGLQQFGNTSKVLKAMGVAESLIANSIRFSIGRFTTIEEVDFAVEYVSELIKFLRN